MEMFRVVPEKKDTIPPVCLGTNSLGLCTGCLIGTGRRDFPTVEHDKLHFSWIILLVFRRILS